MIAVLIYFDRISGFVGQCIDALVPFFIGGALAFILLPLVRRLETFFNRLCRKKPHPRGMRMLAVAISLVCLLLLIGLFMSILLPQISSSIQSVVRQVTRYVNENDETVTEYLKMIGLVDLEVDPLNSAWQNILTSATNYLGFVPTILMTSYNVLYSLIFRLFIGMITCFYLLTDRDRLARQMKKISYALFSRSHADRLIYWTRHANKIFGGFTTGKIVDSLIIGVICYIMMLIMGLEYSVLISVLIGVTNILPFFGPFIGAIPSILILLIVNPASALKFAIFILILQQVDGNVIGPKILGDYTGISSLWTMFAIILGSALFGFVGMLISVPVFALIYAILRTATDAKLRRKQMPVTNEEYDQIPPDHQTDADQSSIS
ncbi:MAG: AI-2E family transporter [Clostridia bacterium]|nr:AI-2E family transporter [Clostridia bacterium]